MLLPALLLLAALLPGAALAQPRSFTCVGAEQLEEDVFAIPFPRGAAAPGETARANLAAAAERAKKEPERNLCVLGHAGAQEGGAQTGLQLAAKRAGEVAAALAKLGLDRDRIRAEARRAAFAKGAVPEARSVTVVLLPWMPAAPRPPEPKPGTPAQAPAAPRPAAPPDQPAPGRATPAVPPPAEAAPLRPQVLPPLVPEPPSPPAEPASRPAPAPESAPPGGVPETAPARP
ncbi:OmpA family protein [Paracraurococcus lichenis]|uniref:OmpA family protein n=1 Tax=Paracraurococcus lichenis TaxID=3064888 RepID=A0ABT9E650_9PROT|nr:OmpA family protein [Paracraurococcus sp. LOR1-02]MDO9711652.1 OmpA family protein [Paracraurococcus sp. LOR1-02]